MGERAAEKIVVGVDGSPASRRALRWAARQAERVGGELHAVSVWASPTTYGWLIPAEDLDWQGHTASTQLEKMIVEVLGGGAAQRVHCEVVEGHPARRLLDAANDADLLVVGSHGHGAIAQLLPGSVTLHAVAHARCPVVVVHETTPPEPDATPEG